jgi:hypothetical protein
MMINDRMNYEPVCVDTVSLPLGDDCRPKTDCQCSTIKEHVEGIRNKAYCVKKKEMSKGFLI